MSGGRKGRRQLASLVAELSLRDRHVLTTASHLRLVTTGQVQRLHFAFPGDHVTSLTAARCCRRVLERLVRDQLLTRLERRIGGVRAGSASFVYGLGSLGQRVLGEDGPRRRAWEPSGLFVGHTLAVGELYVRLHEARRDGELGGLEVQTEPICWRTTTGLGGQVVMLKPDLFVSVASGDLDYRWFVEVDLGTEHAPAVLRKCLAYEQYYRSGVEQHEHGVFPRVLWVVPDDERAGRLRTVIASSGRLTPELFLVTTTGPAVGVLAGGVP